MEIYKKVLYLENLCVPLVGLHIIDYSKEKNFILCYRNGNQIGIDKKYAKEFYRLLKDYHNRGLIK